MLALLLKDLQTLIKHADKLSIERSFYAYIISFFVMGMLGGVAFVFKGLTQLIFSLINVKWFFFVLFALQVVLKKRMQKQLIIVVALEFTMGLLSFFSDFKIVLLYSALVALFFIRRVNIRQATVALISLFMLFFLASKWTAIKGEYRAFLNKGSSSQTVQVSGGSALNKLYELSTKEEEGTNDPTADLLDRLQYTHHLAKTMDRMPSVLPFEYGANWTRIMEFVLTPRMFNPNKPRYEPTAKATKYTGIQYMGYSSGTSFSLGYFVDAFIDFGYIGMFVPLLIIGYIFGSTYFYFVRKSSNNFIFNFAVVSAMYVEFFALESDGMYLMGRLFSTLVMFFILKLFFFRSIYNSLAIKPGDNMNS